MVTYLRGTRWWMRLEDVTVRREEKVYRMRIDEDHDDEGEVEIVMTK